MTLRTRILSSQLAMAIAPAVLIGLIVLFQCGRAFSKNLAQMRSGMESSNTVSKDALIEQSAKGLEHVARDVYAMCQAQQELLQQKLEGDLNVARRTLATNGGITLGTESVEWQAVNQGGGAAVTVPLPKMMLGQNWIGQIKDARETAPAVDEVRQLVGGTCTVFQKMNPAGDMLRVCTNVQKADGTRAIGTYIPALQADGSPSPVIEAVMKGQTYRGRAFVVNAWYITAYEPIKDAEGKTIGMLYVGVKEESAESLRKAIMSVRVGRTGYVYVLNATGATRGHYVVSLDGKRDGENLWETRDPNGRLFIQDICKTALGLQAGAVGEIRYPWQNAGEPAPREKIVKISYFAPWDWVIGVGCYEDEFYEPVKKMEETGRKALGEVEESQAAATRAIYVWSGLIGLATLVIANLIAYMVTRSIAGPLDRIIQGLGTGAEQVHDAAAQVSAASQQLAEGASEQASNLEETSSALEEMAAMTRTNAGSAEEANQLTGKVREAASHGDQTVSELNQAMSAINDSSGKISKIIKVIEEIAFQTNLLALNAAVEAARAGEHGKGFAVVAEEVRNLAQRAGQAARETTSLIEDAVRRAQDGTTVAGQVGAALGTIAADVQKASDLVAGISRASQEQAQGVDQLNTAVSQMDRVTQQNAASAEESASAAEQLTAQAESVKAAVAELMQLVRGGALPAERRVRHTRPVAANATVG